MSANRHKVVKFFSKGFLSEEPVAAGTDLSSWPWSATSSASTSKSQPAFVLTEVEPLYRIERELAGVLLGQKSTNLQRIVRRLEKWCGDHLSSDGFLKSQPWETFRLLPVLFRFRLALNELGWSARCESAFKACIGVTYRCTAGAAGMAFHNGQPSPEFQNLLLTYSKSRDGRSWYNVHHWLWTHSGPMKRTKVADPCMQSDEASVAILRRDWARRPTMAAVDFRQELSMHWQVLGDLICQDSWETQLRSRGKLLQPTSPWEATCWFTDRDGDYLELRRSYGEVTLERQIFLARLTALLIMADTVKSPMANQLSLRWSLPQRRMVALGKKVPTRALDARVGKLTHRLLPLAFPADPSQPAGGNLLIQDSQIVYERAQTTDRLFLPLAWTWASGNLPVQQPWRQLTVTNDRRRVGPNEAIAYRIPVDGRQIVFFRAQVEATRYAFIGYQTMSECVLGEIDTAGDLEPWLLVE